MCTGGNWLIFDRWKREPAWLVCKRYTTTEWNIALKSGADLSCVVIGDPSLGRFCAKQERMSTVSVPRILVERLSYLEEDLALPIAIPLHIHIMTVFEIWKMLWFYIITRPPSPSTPIERTVLPAISRPVCRLCTLPDRVLSFCRSRFPAPPPVPYSMLHFHLLFENCKIAKFSRAKSTPLFATAPAHTSGHHRGCDGREWRQVRGVHGKDYEGQG